jgi:hypothetical protein
LGSSPQKTQKHFSAHKEMKKNKLGKRYRKKKKKRRQRLFVTSAQQTNKQEEVQNMKSCCLS